MNDPFDKTVNQTLAQKLDDFYRATPQGKAALDDALFRMLAVRIAELWSTDENFRKDIETNFKDEAIILRMIDRLGTAPREIV
jgi:hypothetical protein